MRSVFVCEKNGDWFVKIFNPKNRRTTINSVFSNKDNAEAHASIVRYMLKKINEVCMRLGAEKCVK